MRETWLATILLGACAAPLPAPETPLTRHEVRHRLDVLERRVRELKAIVEQPRICYLRTRDAASVPAHRDVRSQDPPK